MDVPGVPLEGAPEHVGRPISVPDSHLSHIQSTFFGIHLTVPSPRILASESYSCSDQLNFLKLPGPRGPERSRR